MAKVLGSWSGMRRRLEDEWLADNLKRRIRYNCTTYVGMDGCHIFEIFVDGRLFKQFSLETLNTYFIQCGMKQNSNFYGKREYWEEFNALWLSIPPEQRTEYTDDEFCTALSKYGNQSISDSLDSGNPLERMFAILDRRVGRRTLQGLKPSLPEQPKWLASLYCLRLNAENML